MDQLDLTAWSDVWFRQTFAEDTDASDALWLRETQKGHQQNAIAFLHQLNSGCRRTLPGSTGKPQEFRSAVVSRRGFALPRSQADTIHTSARATNFARSGIMVSLVAVLSLSCAKACHRTRQVLESGQGGPAASIARSAVGRKRTNEQY